MDTNEKQKFIKYINDVIKNASGPKTSEYPFYGTLDLSQFTNLQDDDLKYINDRYTIDLPQLDIINMKNCVNITDDGLKYVPKYREINLENCRKITNKGLEYLFHIVDKNKIKTISENGIILYSECHTINLSNCIHITDVGLQYLENYNVVYLNGIGQLSDTGLKHLKNCVNFEKNNIINDEVTEVGLAKLVNLKHTMRLIPDNSNFSSVLAKDYIDNFPLSKVEKDWNDTVLLKIVEDNK